MKKLSAQLERIETTSIKVGGIIAAAATVVILILTVGEVIIRKVLHVSMLFGVEYIEYALAISIMYIVADLAKRRGHLAVDVLASKFSGKTRKVMNLVFYLLSFLVYSVFVTYLISRLTTESYLMKVKAFSAMETPLWIPQAVILPGLLLLCFVLLLETIKWFLPGEGQGGSAEGDWKYQD